MRPRPSAVAAIVTLPAGSTVLGCFGLMTTVAYYDGVLSWLNPVASGACCAAVLLAALALPAGRLLGRPAYRDSKRKDT